MESGSGDADSVSRRDGGVGAEQAAAGLKCVNADVSGIHCIDQATVRAKEDGRVSGDGRAGFNQV